jgi:NACalpha-BTF3-like transcription factor
MENLIKEGETKNNTEEVKNNTEENVVLTESEVKKKREEELVKEYYINLQKQKYERFIEIIMNQTTYSKEEAISSLEKHKGDITLVIKEFLGVSDNSEKTKKEQNSKSLHQKRYSVIREYMDNAATNYMKRQEIAKKMNELHERQKAQQAEQAQYSQK